VNGQCFDMPTQHGALAFNSLFGWIGNASLNGTKTIGMHNCDVWVHENNWVCLDGDRPVALNII